MNNMDNIDEQLKLIPMIRLQKRIKREMENIVKLNYCDKNEIKITSDTDLIIIKFKNNKDKLTYEISIDARTYPFCVPKLKINNKNYMNYYKIYSEDFRMSLLKFKGGMCFCCDTILCENNWNHSKTLTDVLVDVETYKNICREISIRIIVDVIKFKYLHCHNINLIEWLFNTR